MPNNGRYLFYSITLVSLFLFGYGSAMFRSRCMLCVLFINLDLDFAVYLLPCKFLSCIETAVWLLATQYQEYGYGFRALTCETAAWLHENRKSHVVDSVASSDSAGIYVHGDPAKKAYDPLIHVRVGYGVGVEYCPKPVAANRSGDLNMTGSSSPASSRGVII